MSKINLYVVYEDKDLARRDGAFLNPDLKTWQCEEKVILVIKIDQVTIFKEKSNSKT